MNLNALDITHVQAPLVFGVTGHRDLREQDAPELEKKVRQILLDFRKEYPSTPFILLSPLAEGADRLAARVALEPEIRARLVVPLPMPQASYEGDFTAAGSITEFHELIERADDHWTFDTETHPKGSERDRQYEAVGKYIASESQILIALWDGAESNKVGGTAAIVKFQTQGIGKQSDCDLLPPELFPVYHILTPRVSNPNLGIHALELKIIYPPAFEKQADAEKYYRRTFGNLEEFNRYALDNRESLTAEAVDGKKDVIGDFDETNLSVGEALTLARYSLADAVARRFQKTLNFTDRLLHTLIFLSFLLLVFFAHWPGHLPIFLAVSFVLLGVAYYRHHSARRSRLDNKCLDYRALAEACRLKLFWQIAGIPDSVPDKYLGRQRTDLDWIRNGLRGWGIASDDRPNAAWTGAGERLKFVQETWVVKQLDYFNAKAKGSLEKSEHMERFVTASLIFAVVTAGAVLVRAACAQLSHGSGWKCPECEWVDYPLIVIDAFLALGAILHHAGHRAAHSEHRKQYDQMGGIFKNANQSIAEKLKSSDFGSVRSCLRKLGDEALSENGEWVLLHRQRPLELPHP